MKLDHLFMKENDPILHILWYVMISILPIFYDISLDHNISIIWGKDGIMNFMISFYKSLMLGGTVTQQLPSQLQGPKFNPELSLLPL